MSNKRILWTVRLNEWPVHYLIWVVQVNVARELPTRALSKGLLLLPVPLLAERHWTTGISLSPGGYRLHRCRWQPPSSPQATSSFASCLCNGDVTHSWRNPTSPFFPHAHSVGQILLKFRLRCRHTEISVSVSLLCRITWYWLSLISCGARSGFTYIYEFSKSLVRVLYLIFNLWDIIDCSWFVNI